LPVVSVGSILEGHDLRLVDEAGRTLAQRQVGEIQVRGPSVITGYWEPASTNGLLTSDGYLRTGDLGYLDGDELYIVGRRKEVIIVNGRNLIPQEVETLASKVIDNGIQQGVAAFGVASRRSGTEALHLMIESRVAPPEHAAAEEALRSACLETFGVGGVHIHWVPKGAIPKTTSGKIRRFECAERVGGL
jgi:acyl-CoA synthetase (AMP-forming)/AMP-acid ligase II